jgi:hypothetical protein
VLQSEKNAMEMLNSMDSFPPEKHNNPNKNAQLDVLKALDDEPLESIQ